MTYEVTYRGRDGRETAEPFEAESREALFRALAARGISPIRVAEAVAGRRTRPSSGGSRPARARLATWAAIGVAVAIGTFFVAKNIEGGGTKATDESEKVRRIVETPPNIPQRSGLNQVEPSAIAPKVEDEKPLPPQRVGELRNGYRLLPDGTLHRVLGIVTNTPPKMSVADKTFTHSADVELGNLLMVEPGDDLLGDTAGMYKGFGKELDEALAFPIEYDKDDTPLQRELKDGVKELRDELVRRRANGEDIEKVMEDAREQLKELSLYRQELEEQVRGMANTELTQQDYEDLVSAANQMLADRGIKPLEMPATLKHAIRLRQIQEAAANRQAEKEEQHE